MRAGLATRAKARLRQTWESARRCWYRVQLSWSCWWHDGSMVTGPRLVVHHRSLFQGAGSLKLGENVSLGYPLGGYPGTPILFQPRNRDAEIEVGSDTFLMNGSYICACEAIHIGENCRLGANCVIFDSDFHGIRPDERNQPGNTAPVWIGDNVWFGVSVTVLKGVRIGNDAVIGAMAVVTKSVPDGAIAAGNPAKVIGSVYE